MGIEGIQFVTDAEGHRVAVQLDLKRWGDLWEDLYDNIIAQQRANEPRVSLDEFERELRDEGLLGE